MSEINVELMIDELVGKATVALEKFKVEKEIEKFARTQF